MVDNDTRTYLLIVSDMAERSLVWLGGKGSNTSILKELADMSASKEKSASQLLTLSAMMLEFKQPIAYKTFIILMFTSLLGMLSGGMTLLVYSVTILDELGFSGKSLPSISTHKCTEDNLMHFKFVGCQEHQEETHDDPDVTCDGKKSKVPQ